MYEAQTHEAPSPGASSPRTPRRTAGRGVLRSAAGLAVLAAALLAGGCASSGAVLTGPELREVVARQGIDPSGVELPFRTDAAMREWLEEHVTVRHRPEIRVRRLLDELLGADGLGLTYDASFTGMAPEAFRQRRANCLGFTNLFVALGRELGVPVYFLAVDEVESFSRAESEDLVVVSRHVTAGYGPRHQLTVLEFSLGPEVDYRSVRPLSDRTAAALYYSNRGAERLQEGEPEAARELLAVAVAVDPELPLAWVNLGVALRRLGELDAAEAAYHQALAVDSRTVSAYQNLAALARARGDEVAAEAMLAVIPHLKSRNPYNYLTLGDHALARDRLEEAGRYYRQAHRLYRNHPEPRASLGLLALARGERGKAQRWLRKAARLDPDNPRVERLRQRLEGSGRTADGGRSPLRPPG